MKPLLNIAQLTLLEGWRTKLLWLILFLAGAACGVAWFIEQLALTEHRQVFVSFLAPLLRITSVLLVIFHVTLQGQRELDERLHWSLLVHAIPRWQWFAGRMVGYILIAMVIAGICGLPVLFNASSINAVIWVASLVLEASLVAAISYLLVVTLTGQIKIIFAALSIYLLGRTSGLLIKLSQSQTAGLEMNETSWQNFSPIVQGLMRLIDSFVPKFNAFSQTDWLIEKLEDTHTILIVLQQNGLQTLLYLVLIMVVAQIDLRKQEL